MSTTHSYRRRMPVGLTDTMDIVAWQDRIERIVRQSHACHPAWPIDTHVGYLVNEEFEDEAMIDRMRLAMEAVVEELS